jgi:peptidoglycan/xylan/chitin deacetylase (PgdA/CDA1 family)
MRENGSVARNSTHLHQGEAPADALLTYHELERQPSRDQYAVSCQNFERHLQGIKKLITGSKIKSGLRYISFDDGHRTNVEMALPCLKRNNLKAIFFVTAGWIGTKRFAMGWNELAVLLASGHSVQSHGFSHIFLNNCSRTELCWELRGSKELLEDHLGIAVNSISIPGGRWNDRVIKACAAAGYRHVYTSDPILQPRSEHGVYVHGRIMVRQNTRVAEIEKFLTGNRSYWLSLHARHMVKEGLRAILGDANYHALWRKMSRRVEPQDNEEP